MTFEDFHGFSHHSTLAARTARGPVPAARCFLELPRQVGNPAAHLAAKLVTRVTASKARAVRTPRTRALE